MSDLSGSGSQAFGINGAGQIVGWSDLSSGFPHAFLDSGGIMVNLGALAGGSFQLRSGY